MKILNGKEINNLRRQGLSVSKTPKFQIAYDIFQNPLP